MPLESNDGGQLTERLAGYAQQAPILDAWLARFPTLRKPLPAQQTLPEVAAAVDGVAKQILASKAAVNVLKVQPHAQHTLAGRYASHFNTIHMPDPKCACTSCLDSAFSISC